MGERGGGREEEQRKSGRERWREEEQGKSGGERWRGKGRRRRRWREEEQRKERGWLSAHHVLLIFLPPSLPLSSGGRRLMPGGCSGDETKITIISFVLLYIPLPYVYMQRQGAKVIKLCETEAKAIIIWTLILF